MGIKNLLGKRIKEIRKSKHLTQEQLAEMIGVETPSISNMENGKYYPNAENLDKIMNAFNITPDELFNCASYDTPEKLIDEMVFSMKNNTDLTRKMYKFYLSVKY